MSKRNRRSDVFHHGEVGVAHCIQRCVRRAFLAGKDAVTGRSFEYRRDWIRKRLELLASVFGIDILNYAIMSNHLHVLLRTRPDVVKTWKDEEIAKRWLRLFPGNGSKSSLGNQPNKTSLAPLGTPRRSLNGGSDCRISLGSCEPLPNRSLAEPTRRTTARDDFGRGDLRLRRWSTKQDSWPALCMSISILCEPPWLSRLSNRSLHRHTIESHRSLGTDRFLRFARWKASRRMLHRYERS